MNLSFFNKKAASIVFLVLNVFGLIGACICSITYTIFHVAFEDFFNSDFFEDMAVSIEKFALVFIIVVFLKHGISVFIGIKSLAKKRWAQYTAAIISGLTIMTYFVLTAFYFDYSSDTSSLISIFTLLISILLNLYVLISLLAKTESTKVNLDK